MTADIHVEAGNDVEENVMSLEGGRWKQARDVETADDIHVGAGHSVEETVTSIGDSSGEG
jgi:hypothetical protein